MLIFFYQKQVNPFGNASLQEIFFQRKNVNNLGIFGQNTKRRWSHKLETLHEDNLGPNLKKPRKQQICGGSPSL